MARFDLARALAAGSGSLANYYAAQMRRQQDERDWQKRRKQTLEDRLTLMDERAARERDALEEERSQPFALPGLAGQIQGAMGFGGLTRGQFDDLSKAGYLASNLGMIPRGGGDEQPAFDLVDPFGRTAQYPSQEKLDLARKRLYDMGWVETAGGEWGRRPDKARPEEPQDYYILPDGAAAPYDSAAQLSRFIRDFGPSGADLKSALFGADANADISWTGDGFKWDKFGPDKHYDIQEIARKVRAAIAATPEGGKDIAIAAIWSAFKDLGVPEDARPKLLDVVNNEIQRQKDLGGDDFDALATDLLGGF